MAFSRRKFLGAAAVAAVSGAAARATPAPHPEADLIALCAEHTANRDALNRADTGLEDDDPLWLAYERTRDAISKAKPQTLEGALAKARAAKGEARNPDGSEDPEGSPAAIWAWDIVNDLLRLHGRV